MAEDFFPKCYLFYECNSVRIGQNIQNEVSLERSIFADVVANQFINLNGKLIGSRKEDMHRSIWNENDQMKAFLKDKQEMVGAISVCIKL